MVKYYILAIFFLSLDRLFKLVAIEHFDQENSFSIIKNVLSFTFAKNYFIAFSLPVTGIFLNIAIFVIILALAVYSVILAKSKNFIYQTLLFFTILGASSNLFDRIKYGYVIDYLDLTYFTIFNMADAMIVCSIAILIWMEHKQSKKVNNNN